jgi:acetoacetate decarboxylase
MLSSAARLARNDPAQISAKMRIMPHALGVSRICGVIGASIFDQKDKTTQKSPAQWRGFRNFISWD